MPFIPELLQYKNEYFFETGTYKGETLDIVLQAGYFNYIQSMELSDVFYNRCLTKYINTPIVKLYYGNSKYDLYDIIKDINSPITFWLDSHWSGTPDVG